MVRDSDEAGGGMRGRGGRRRQGVRVCDAVGRLMAPRAWGPARVSQRCWKHEAASPSDVCSVLVNTNELIQVLMVGWKFQTAGPCQQGYFACDLAWEIPASTQIVYILLP